MEQPDYELLLAEVQILRVENERIQRRFDDRRRDERKAKVVRRAERLRDEKVRQWKALVAQRDQLAKWIYLEYDPASVRGRGVHDHACAECVPHGSMVIEGFECAVHIARRLRTSSASPGEP